MKSIIFSLWNLLVETIQAVLTSLSHNWLVLALAIVTAVILKTYVNTEKLNQALLKRKKVSIFVSVLFGAFTPFCACGTTAVIIGMLSTTLPWGPIMAFLTSSPLMSPDGFIMISGVIGLRFAIALTLASLVIGICSGFLTTIIDQKTTFLHNQTRYFENSQPASCSCSSTTQPISGDCPTSDATVSCDCTTSQAYTSCGCSTSQASTSCSCSTNAEPASCACTASEDITQHNIGAVKRQNILSGFITKYKLDKLASEFINLGLRQILLYFCIFIAVGYLINHFVPTSIISVLFGKSSILAVPLASLIGLPLYITTESDVPIMQSMIQSGAGEGAMLAFIITGSATSAWVIAGLSTFLKKRAIILYVGYILAGGILSGYIYEIITMIFI